LKAMKQKIEAIEWRAKLKRRLSTEKAIELTASCGCVSVSGKQMGGGRLADVERTLTHTVTHSHSGAYLSATRAPGEPPGAAR
jgi:hypothetical protein